MSVKTKKTKTRKAKPALKTEVIRQIKRSKVVIGGLIISTGKSYPTVMRWINDNSQQLTQAACLGVICTELKLTQSEVLN
jgi:UDP-N-acetyl-D-mannosaminuronic acid transferase (WecB/TagA/CpsF family)